MTSRLLFASSRILLKLCEGPGVSGPFYCSIAKHLNIMTAASPETN